MPRHAQCISNLKYIGLALHNYHEAFGCFPPAYVADETGKPMHSWRVLILPFMSDGSLFKAYNMAEPWDGPNNRKLLDQRPGDFGCPSRDAMGHLTSYVAIVGPKTTFPGSKSRRIAEIGDGTIETILLAEVSNVDIPWTEPRDLDVETMSWIINDPSKPAVSSVHRRAPTLLFADGTVRSLSTLSPAVLKAMSTIDGGEGPNFHLSMR